MSAIAATMVSSWVFVRVLGVDDLAKFHQHLRKVRARPTKKGRRKQEGDLWSVWLVFATLVARRVADRLNLTPTARLTLHHALLDMGAAGFRAALVDGRGCMLIARGVVCPLLMRRESIEAAAKEDPIGSRDSHILDIGQMWVEFIPQLEAIVREEQETRLERATAAAASN